MIKSYKELIVWQRSIELVKEIYITTSQLPKEELYGLSSQMRRSSVSISSNIAEGYQRKNRKEYLQFLRIAFGSGAELETQLIITTELFQNINFDKATNLLDETQKMLNVLINKLESS